MYSDECIKVSFIFHGELSNVKRNLRRSRVILETNSDVGKLHMLKLLRTADVGTHKLRSVQKT